MNEMSKPCQVIFFVSFKEGDWESWRSVQKQLEKEDETEQGGVV